jgi:type IV secretion system protein TrbL
MNDLGIIDQFLSVFSTYIDSGFGLIGGDVHSLTVLLIGLDATLAGLFWALGGEQDVIGRFVRKILYVGAFAYILNNFSTLADIIYRSFASIGLEAGGGGLSAADLLRPGKLAGTGFSAAWPLLNQASQMMGIASFFDNLLTIAILLLAWVIVVLAFFVLAVQLFVTILEFKLTSLAGFVLVPFALWNRTSFLAERVLGNVVSSGVKVMVLAIIVGIGSTFFTQFTSALRGQQPDIAQAMSLMLASLSLFGLGIFGPSIASGLVAGAPQLGAGAALGAASGAAGTLALAGGAALGAVTAGAGAALGAVRAATSMGTAASTAAGLGQAAAGSSSFGAGASGIGRAAGNAAKARMSDMLGLKDSAERGRQAATSAYAGNGGASGSSAGSPTGDAAGAPDWARRLRAEQTARHRRQTAAQSLKEGDGGGASANPDISEKED